MEVKAKSNLECQAAEQSSFHSNWQIECVESFRFEMQIVELHIAFEYGNFERLGIKPIYIVAQVLVQVKGNLTFQHKAQRTPMRINDLITIAYGAA